MPLSDAAVEIEAQTIKVNKHLEFVPAQHNLLISIAIIYTRAYLAQAN